MVVVVAVDVDQVVALCIECGGEALLYTSLGSAVAKKE
jgi:hypothetical protein